MNAKDMAQVQDDPRMGALRRRLQKQPPSAPVDKNKEVTDERKNMGY